MSKTRFGSLDGIHQIKKKNFASTAMVSAVLFVLIFIGFLFAVSKATEGSVSEQRQSLSDAIDRAVTWKTVLEPEYNAGKTILLDRYTTSSMIYQSTLIDEEKKEEFIKYVVDYEYNKLGVAKPDMVIFLTAPFDLVTKIRNARKGNDGVANDIHERDLHFMKKVYENANRIARDYSWNIIECGKENSLRTPEDISEEIYGLVKKLK